MSSIFFQMSWEGDRYYHCDSMNREIYGIALEMLDSPDTVCAFFKTNRWEFEVEKKDSKILYDKTVKCKIDAVREMQLLAKTHRPSTDNPTLFSCKTEDTLRFRQDFAIDTKPLPEFEPLTTYVIHILNSSNQLPTATISKAKIQKYLTT